MCKKKNDQQNILVLKHQELKKQHHHLIKILKCVCLSNGLAQIITFPLKHQWLKKQLGTMSQC